MKGNHLLHHRRGRLLSHLHPRARDLQSQTHRMNCPRRTPAYLHVCLESGVEVDGVWISRGNTPEPVSRETSPFSSIVERLPRNDRDLNLEKQARGHRRSRSNSPATSIRPGRSSSDRAISLEADHDTQPKREASPNASSNKPIRSRYPPLSYSRYQGNPYILRRQSSATSTLLGLEAIHRASTSISGNGEGSTESSSSSISTGDAGSISSSAPDLLNPGMPRSKLRQVSSASDLELLNSHRLSQAAETGQLTPRTRKAANSFETTGLGRHSTTSVHGDLAGYFSFKQPRESSPRTPPSPHGSSPKLDALPAAVRRSSMPDVTPFAQFVQTAPTSPRPTSMQSAKDSSEQRREPSMYESVPSSPTKAGAPLEPSDASTMVPITIEPTSVPQQQEVQTKRPSFEKERRPSQVIRGHGSGFEILKAGSLNPAMPMEKQQAAPPVSLQKYRHARSRSSSADSTRKLQKKRRPSIDSQTSSDGTCFMNARSCSRSPLSYSTWSRPAAERSSPTKKILPRA